MANKRIANQEFLLVFDNSEKPKIVVSKKVAKKAVDRNRIKRIIKEAIRKLEIEKKPTIIVRTNIANLKTHQVTDKLLKLLK